MKLAIVHARGSAGMHAPPVTVEVHISRGVPRVNMVGLPETAVQESRDRVRSALLNTGFEFPRRRITINLAPADIPKEGGRFDLPIALGILVASGQLEGKRLPEFEFAGELALSGALRPVRGVLPLALAARNSGRALVIPAANSMEAARVSGVEVFQAAALPEVCAFLKGDRPLPRCLPPAESFAKVPIPDLSDVCGQAHARRALEIAATGQHSVLFIGPPGTGKTMLASRLPGILPSLDEEAALQVATVASISSGGFDPVNWCRLPFRAPHHGSSSAALIGGGRPPKPGEISLAHRGVLFLDELPEFDRRVLESLREPLESGNVTISRAAHQAVFPAEFQLVAAMNPCPCGFLGSQRVQCRCSDKQIQRYLGKISGPLLDRIDMHVEVQALPPGVLLADEDREDSETVQKRVIAVRARQMARQGVPNHLLSGKNLNQYCPMDASARKTLGKLAERFNLSARVCHRLTRIARTIADMAGHDILSGQHVAEAFAYRSVDRLACQMRDI